MSHSLSSNSAAHRTSVAHHISRSQLLAALLAFTCVLLGTYRCARGGDVKYVYDELGRLVQVINATNGNTAIYKYDAVGNLLSITTGSSTPGSSVSISQISPDSGPVGTQVTISGSGFSATASLDSVSFNGTAATVSSASANTIVAVVPAGATTGPVTVTSPNGLATTPEPFTVTAASNGPAISGFNPSDGRPGTAVTISGTGFASPLSDNLVYFNVTPADVTSGSSTSLNVVVPPTATTGPLSVTTPNGQASSSADFFVIPSGVTPGYEGQLTAPAPAGPAQGSSPSLASGQSALFAFAGAAGQTVSIGIQSGNCGTVSVDDPGGNVMTSYNYCYGGTFIDALFLPTAGTYTIIVTPSGGGTVAVQVYDSTPIEGSIAISSPSQPSPVTINPASPGQDAYLSFTISGVQKVSLNITSSTLSQPVVSILAPDGSTVTSTGTMFSDWSFLDVTTLQGPGTFMVFVDSGSRAGSITLQLNDATPLTDTISVPTANTTTSKTETLGPGQDAYVTFAGTTNQQISLYISHTLGSPTVTILNPDGSQLVTTGTLFGSWGFIDSLTLPQTGTYTIFVDTGV